MPKSKATVRWLDDSESHDYPAAFSYLCLIYPPRRAKQIVSRLKSAGIAEFKSKDISRASGLPLLGVSNSHVEHDRDKIKGGERLSPILLVRDFAHGKVIIADGYHRLCAIYAFDEDAVIRCKICDG
ncbi:MAG TPA: hypothetical protein VMI53_02235 [Opitutaceae bacterium]|nr:hypothetical protein [Opitutaceae bacterium]